MSLDITARIPYLIGMDDIAAVIQQIAVSDVGIATREIRPLEMVAHQPSPVGVVEADADDAGDESMGRRNDDGADGDHRRRRRRVRRGSEKRPRIALGTAQNQGAGDKIAGNG